MTKAEQKQKIDEFVARGEEIGRTERVEFGGISQIKGPRFETWISEINVFNERHLKDYPLYSGINSACFQHSTDRKCYQNMMGYLHALANDIEYWEESQQNNDSPIIQMKEKGRGEKSKMIPIIFVSHRTEDAEVADMLRDYLVATGVPNEYVFCSSLPGNDVNSVISREVKDKIANSTVNIVILSHGYYESTYCINEAGIIWLHDPKTPAIVVGLPEISHSNMYGFLNSDYKLRRLDNANDISEIYDIVRKAVRTTQTTLSVATAACQKLLNRYTEYIKSRVALTEPEKKPIISGFTIDDVTTDDERVVLYYILTKKVRRIQKSDVEAWLNETEIYNINVENALDLLASIGVGTYEEETLSMDINAFRKYTANADQIISALTPIVETHQSLSSKRFVDMWEAGAFTDEDKLFVAYIIQNRTTTFGVRWMEERQIEDIKQWESSYCLDCSLANTYSSHINQFIDNRLVYESNWTSYGNAREYTLCPSLKELLFGANFPYVSEIATVIEAHNDPLPF